LGNPGHRQRRNLASCMELTRRPIGTGGSGGSPGGTGQSSPRQGIFSLMAGVIPAGILCAMPDHNIFSSEKAKDR